MLCSSIFFLSFHKHTSRDQASSLILETPTILSHTSPSLPILSSVVQPRNLIKPPMLLSSSSLSDRRQATISKKSKHHLSSLEPFDFKPCYSITSLFLLCQANTEPDETFVKLLKNYPKHLFIR
ncbi:unnamed protein product, partial [Prunus brigantina]